MAGDVVNTASRLQSAAPVDGVIVGDETYAATQDAIDYRPGHRCARRARRACRGLARAAGDAPTASVDTRVPLVGRERELTCCRDLGAGLRRASPSSRDCDRARGNREVAVGLEFDRTSRLGGRTAPRPFAPVPREQRVLRLRDAGEAAVRDLRERPPEAHCEVREHIATLPSGVDVASTRHLAILLGLDSEGTVDDRETLFFSVRCFIESVARDRPTLLVFEDIHWSDRGLLDLIELLAARLRDLPIMLLALARPELLTRAQPGAAGCRPTRRCRSPALEREAQELAGCGSRT